GGAGHRRPPRPRPSGRGRPPPARGAAVIARPVPGRPAPGGGLAVLVVVTVLAVLAAPPLGPLHPLVDQLRQTDPSRLLPHRPTPPAGEVCPVMGPVRIGQ